MVITPSSLNQGKLLAALLAGAWRAEVQPASMSSIQLELVLPLVLKSGTAGLAWRRIRGTDLATTPAGRSIQQTRLTIAAEGAIRESQMNGLMSLCRLEPGLILGKGWAHARLYPEPALRPYGDFDLFAAPLRYERALSAHASILAADRRPSMPVDLHQCVVDLPDRSWDEVRARARALPLRRSSIFVLGPEDALRLCCLHLLRHATEMPPRCSPLWLCDVSVMLEALPPDFDWDYCLSGNARRTGWMLAVMRLAHYMLGARLEGCPKGKVPASIPRWMTRTFLSVWGQTQWNASPRPLPRPLSKVGWHPREWPHILGERWPAPLESIYRLNWPITRVSGPVAQVVDYAARALSWGPRQIGPGRGGRRRHAPKLEVGTTA